MSSPFLYGVCTLSAVVQMAVARHLMKPSHIHVFRTCVFHLMHLGLSDNELLYTQPLSDKRKKSERYLILLKEVLLTKLQYPPLILVS